MLVADTLTADLTFYANGAASTAEWAGAQALRGVSRGRHDPLRAARARAAARRARGLLRAAARVTRCRGRHAGEGLEAVRCAEAVLASAASAARRVARSRGAAADARGRRRAGQGRPAAGRAIARGRARGRRLRHRPAGRASWSTPGARRSPARRAAEALAEPVADGRLRAVDRHRRRPSPRARPRGRGPAAGGRRDARARLAHPRRRRGGHRPRAAGRDHRRASRRRCRSARPATRIAPALEAASAGCAEGADFHVVFSPERVFSGA